MAGDMWNPLGIGRNWPFMSFRRTQSPWNPRDMDFQVLYSSDFQTPCLAGAIFSVSFKSEDSDPKYPGPDSL